MINIFVSYLPLNQNKKYCHELIHHSESHIEDCPLVKAKKTLRRDEVELQYEGKTYLVSVDPIIF